MTTHERFKRNRMAPDARSDTIVESAAHLALTKGYTNVSANDVAAVAMCSRTLVNNYFTQQELRDAVMKWAIRNNNAQIILQGIVVKDPIAMTAPQDLKDRAITILNYEE